MLDEVLLHTQKVVARVGAVARARPLLLKKGEIRQGSVKA
jgi:hypothetical protein